MIVGGSAEGDSFRARKAGERAFKIEAEKELYEVGHVCATPRSHVGPEDGEVMRDNHSDALLITTDVAGYNVA